MAYNTLRELDMAAEREVALFLDKHLYSQPLFTKAERTDDIQTQMEGSDIIVSIPSLGIENAVVDEKAPIHYINKNLRTFVLEISFLNSGLNYSEGWFINDLLKTEYYLMQWIKADVDKWWQVKAKNITEIECVLVSKAKLKKYFEGEGYDKERLLDIAKEMRAKDITTKEVPGKPYYFYYSNGKKLAEKPVNIVFQRNEYIRLGEFHYFIKPQ